MIAASHDLPLRIYHAIPSCVPATAPEIEWTHQVFDAATIRRLARLPTVIALGEVMDYRGLLGPNERLRAIVAAAREEELLIEGHIPTLAGLELSQYLAHGVSSDHTLTFAAKIEEQTSKGLAIMLQTKSLTPENVAAVAALPDRSRIILVTDDIEPSLLDGRARAFVAHPGAGHRLWHAAAGSAGSRDHSSGALPRPARSRRHRPRLPG